MGESLTGKSILVAGATGGLGSEFVRRMCATDCSLMLVYQSDSDRLAALKSDLRQGLAHVSYYQ